MVALASLALQSAKKLFKKGNLENKRLILTLSGADVSARSIGIDLYTKQLHVSKVLDLLNIGTLMTQFPLKQVGLCGHVFKHH